MRSDEIRKHNIWRLCLLCLILQWNRFVVCWNPSPNPTINHNPSTRKKFLDTLATCTALPTTLLTISPTYCDAAITTKEDADEDFLNAFSKSLSLPTDERPPIALPNVTRLDKDNNQRQVNPPPPTQVDAFISLQNQQIRPSPADILVIQVFDSPSQTRLLGGAKVSVARIRFPIQVKLTSSNADSEAWNDLATSQDLWLVATVCPEGTICPGQDSSRFQASGISKFLTSLPGLDNEAMRAMGQTGIRLPTTLVLEQM